MLREKYSALSQREQQTLLLATPIVISLLLWLMVLKPVLQHQSTLEKQLQQKQIDLAWMRKVQPQLKQPSSSKVSTRPLRQQVTLSLRQQQITPKRIQSNQSNQLSIWADSVPFQRVLQTIETSQRRGLNLMDAQISKTEISGMVSIKLTFGH